MRSQGEEMTPHPAGIPGKLGLLESLEDEEEDALKSPRWQGFV